MCAEQPDIVEVVATGRETEVKQPPLYRVVIYNDDYTTKNFVVELLVYVFHKGAAEATELMRRVHREGRGVAGVYPREVAETKIATGKALARDNGFPLQFSMEPDA